VRNEDLQARKELLIAQSEFDRLAFAMALHDVRRVVRPSLDASRRAHASSPASKLLAFAAPLMGTARMSRIVRALSIALTIYRFMRGR
jgi:hypothetical protein